MLPLRLVLVVEGYPGIARAILRDLQEMDVAVCEAEDWLSGQRILRDQEGVQLLVLDTDTTGPEIMDEIPAGFPVVVISDGLYGIPSREHLTCIEKPFSSNELARALTRAMS